jgi:hypothetical protein
MRYISKATFLGFFFLISVACSYLNPFDRNAKTENWGPGEWHSLVVYFKSGTTPEQVEVFKYTVLLRLGLMREPRNSKKELVHIFD